MAITPYRNFDLQIQRDNEGTGYIARAQSPSGEGATRFVLPFSTLELEHFVLSITPGRGRTRRIDTPDVALAKRFGEQLFATVFAGDVGGLLRSSLQSAEQTHLQPRPRP